MRGCLPACSAKDLISQLLTVDATKRLSATEALQHKWVVGTLHEPAQLTRTRENMRKHLRSRWKVWGSGVILFQWGCVLLWQRAFMSVCTGGVHDQGRALRR